MFYVCKRVRISLVTFDGSGSGPVDWDCCTAAAPIAVTKHGSKSPGALPGVATQPVKAGQGDSGAAAAAPHNPR